MNEEVWKAVEDLRKEGGEGVLVTIVSVEGSTPRGVGSKMLWRADGRHVGSIGGGHVEGHIGEDCAQVLASGEARSLRIEMLPEEGMPCAGTVEVLLEPIAPLTRVIILGTGHVGAAIARAVEVAGLSPVLVEETPPELHASDAFVAATRSPERDAVGLAEALRAGAIYVGLLGGKAKAEMVREVLTAQGFDDAAIDSIRCPVGLDIGAETPGEIAVAVVAEVIGVMRGK